MTSPESRRSFEARRVSAASGHRSHWSHAAPIGSSNLDELSHRPRRPLLPGRGAGLAVLTPHRLTFDLPWVEDDFRAL